MVVENWRMERSRDRLEVAHSATAAIIFSTIARPAQAGSSTLGLLDLRTSPCFG